MYSYCFGEAVIKSMRVPTCSSTVYLPTAMRVTKLVWIDPCCTSLQPNPTAWRCINARILQRSTYSVWLLCVCTGPDCRAGWIGFTPCSTTVYIQCKRRKCGYAISSHMRTMKKNNWSFNRKKVYVKVRVNVCT